MATYIETTLGVGEKVLHWGRLSLWGHAGKILLSIFCLPRGALSLYENKESSTPGLMLILLGAGLALYVFVQYSTTEAAVTNKRVVTKSGFVFRKTIELRLQKVESVQVHQSIVGRILNYGDIQVAGAGTPQEAVKYISRPMEFRKACMDAAEVVTAPAVELKVAV